MTEARRKVQLDDIVEGRDISPFLPQIIFKLPQKASLKVVSVFFSKIMPIISQ